VPSSAEPLDEASAAQALYRVSAALLLIMIEHSSSAKHVSPPTLGGGGGGGASAIATTTPTTRLPLTVVSLRKRADIVADHISHGSAHSGAIHIFEYYCSRFCACRRLQISATHRRRGALPPAGPPNPTAHRSGHIVTPVLLRVRRGRFALHMVWSIVYSA